MIKRFTTTALALGFCFSAFAQDTPDAAIVQKIRKEGLENSKAMDIAFNLTDVSGPRLSNSPGLKKAQDWAVKQLTDWGSKMRTSRPGEPSVKAGKSTNIMRPPHFLSTMPLLPRPKPGRLAQTDQLNRK
ncbi:hypothetical protein [Pedobacter sp. HDW13]|uniref:hypothetical protein n=1 Tax=Pedobacter sp. HDW13 TaxID=2714940 RepID=UPI00197E891A|nr:hypothetical protein [Pedobacter sp. HDW13]